MTDKKQMNPFVEALVVFAIFALTGWGMYAYTTGIAEVLAEGQRRQSCAHPMHVFPDADQHIVAP